MSSNNTKRAVPRRRFAEFQNCEGWSCVSLSDISTRITEKVGNLRLETVSISAGIGFVSQAEKFGRNISGEQYKNYIVLNEGDFSYNKGNSKRFPQGCIYRLKEFEKVAAPNAFISFRLNKGHVAGFYQGYFDNNFHGQQLVQFLTSGARSDGLLNVNVTDFFSIKLLVPSEKEQQKIADCLASIDALIAAEQQKLDALRRYKTGLMQQLFPSAGQTVPTLRFAEFTNAPAWEVKPLEQICNINPQHEGIPEQFVYIDLESVIDGNLILKKEIHKKSAPSRAQRVISNGDVIYQTVRPYQRNNLLCNFNDNQQYVASTGYAQLRAFESEGYLYHFLYTDLFVNKVMAGCTGSSYPAINTADLAKILVFIPTKDEQQKIADCLSAFDARISAQQQTIAALHTHKRGLLQQLFPSVAAVTT